MEQAIKHPFEPQHPNLKESTEGTEGRVGGIWLNNEHRLLPSRPY